MSFKFKTRRFHILFGPPTLFERVRYKFQENRNLKLHGNHFNERLKQRLISNDMIERLQQFTQKEWNIVTAEVRCDTGKFVNSTWEITLDGANYWVTIGLGDVIQTIIIKDSSGLGYDYVKKGSLYNFVSEINRKMMEEVI